MWQDEVSGTAVPDESGQTFGMPTPIRRPGSDDVRLGGDEMDPESAMAREGSDTDDARLRTNSAARAASEGRYYATRLRQLARLELEEEQAEELWRSVGKHRQELQRLLARDVGQRVALLDYIVNVRPHLVEPQIIEKTHLEAIEQQAVVDSLTGLYNRRHFEKTLAHAWSQCDPDHATLSLMLFDLDEFKEVNDRLGHFVGDRVLQRVGALVLHQVRVPHVACRYGGDEFAVILPDTKASEALVVGERLRHGIAAAFSRDPVAGKQLQITCSAGVAERSPEMATAQALVRVTDRALYDAKEAGGNRVMRSGASPA
jgi:diguanylate cyclase (GGDEF)-like protein